MTRTNMTSNEPVSAAAGDRPSGQSSGEAQPSRGHRSVPHTADVIIEAWAPTRSGCFEEAVAGLADCFVAVPEPVTTRPVPFDLDRARDDELLVLLLEEIIYMVEVLGVVVVSAEVAAGDGGGIAGYFDTVPVDEGELIGAVPKAVARHDLVFAKQDTRWLCRVMIDV